MTTYNINNKLETLLGISFPRVNQKIDLLGTTNFIFSNNLTISGILQSPKTDLLSVSSSVMDGKIGTIIGVSIPQALTRNETIVPSSF